MQNKSILTGNNAGSLFVLSPDLSSVKKIDSPIFRGIRHIDYGIDSNQINIVSDDFGIYTFDLEKEVVCKEKLYEGHLDTITSIDCLSQKPAILTSSLDGTVRMWDTRNGENRVLYENKEVDVWAVKYFEAKDSVVAGDENGNLNIIDYK